jgi:hypothetical protein
VADAPNDAKLEAPDPGNSSSSESRIQSLLSERGPLIIAIGATVASLVLICLFAFLLVRNQIQGKLHRPHFPLVVQQSIRIPSRTKLLANPER